MARKTKLERDLDRLAELFIPKIKAAFLASIADIKSRAILTKIIEAIRSGDLEGAFAATGLSPAAMRPITTMIEQAYEQGGVTTGNSFPNGLTNNIGQSVIFRFDVRNSRAEAWLRDHSSTLVTRITDDVRTVIRETIEAGVADGRNPKNIGLDIVGRVVDGKRTGGVVGLTTQQGRWLSGARRALDTLDPAYFNYKGRDKRFDGIVQKAITAKKPLDQAKVDALVNRYNDTLLRQRGETIGRTETVQSLNKAQFDAYMQAVDAGTIREQDVTKEWDATGDERTRLSHRVLDGRKADLTVAFTSPSTGAHMMHPGDISMGAHGEDIINCRCRVRYRVDWFANVD